MSCENTGVTSLRSWGLAGTVWPAGRPKQPRSRGELAAGEAQVDVVEGRPAYRNRADRQRGGAQPARQEVPLTAAQRHGEQRADLERVVERKAAVAQESLHGSRGAERLDLQHLVAERGEQVGGRVQRD